MEDKAVQYIHERSEYFVGQIMKVVRADIRYYGSILIGVVILGFLLLALVLYIRCDNKNNADDGKERQNTNIKSVGDTHYHVHTPSLDYQPTQRIAYNPQNANHGNNILSYNNY